MSTTPVKRISDEQYAAILAFVDRPEVTELFAQAVAQGLHAPFALDADYWGRQYQEKLLDLLDELGTMPEVKPEWSEPVRKATLIALRARMKRESGTFYELLRQAAEHLQAPQDSDHV